MDTSVEYLIRRFGKDKVLIRPSSSGRGYHVRVLTDVDRETEMAIRLLLNDCTGRQISDKIRKRSNMTTSRLFGIKGTVDLTDDYKKVKNSKVENTKKWR